MPLPAWAPTLAQVAAYVPRRTLVGAVDGHGDAVATFTADTYPTADSVTKLIADAAQWVLLATGTLDGTLYESGTACAAMRAAGMVSLGYPDNRDDLDDVKALLGEATAMRKDLAAANIALSADDPGTTADNLLPVWSFPEPAAHGDLLL